jgi:chromosome segregation protein
MVHFSKLKLYGFKSFVDKTELEIGAGLNGIVGPNGCGKSNLVEALRWVMGEKSAKNMRGAGMEDVIFAGTSKRPARNLAEVTVVMNNEDGTAPAPFTASTEIEINRKIEKDKGSQYRVNGKAVRARDVNLLFADTMTGATSPALVSQGKITEIINAKPADRRKILEESAGISGLHTRRHEAELRLRAAEQNLTRLDDSLGEVRSRLSSLKRQARQAERYKDINDQIRHIDMALNWAEWQTCHTAIRDHKANFASANDAVQAALIDIQKLTKQIESIETSLPDTRKNHMEASAILQNFRVSLDRLEQDIQSKTKGLQDAIQSKDQLEQDQDYLIDTLETIKHELAEAKTDLETLNDAGNTLPTQIETADNDLKSKREALESLASEKQTLETAMAVEIEGRMNLERQYNDALTQKYREESVLQSLTDEQTAMNNDLASLKSHDLFIFDFDQGEKDMSDLTFKIEQAIENQDKLAATKQTAQNKYDDVNNQINALNGELGALQNLLSQHHNDDDLDEGDKLLSHLEVTQGYEKAVSATLGQWLSLAGRDDTASVYWDKSSAIVDTPKDAESLSQFVKSDGNLQIVLNATGVVDALPNTNTLSVGQMLVTKTGACMRWDGLRVSDTAQQSQDTSGMILEQKNRVADIEKSLSSLENNKQKYTDELDAVGQSMTEATSQINDLKSQLQTQDKELSDKRNDFNRLKDKQDALLSRLSDMDTRITAETDALNDLKTKLTDLKSQLDGINDQSQDDNVKKIETLNSDIKMAQDAIYDAQNTLSELKQALISRGEKHKNLTSTIEKLSDNHDKTNTRLTEMATRLDNVNDKILTLKASQNDEDADSLCEDLLNKITGQEKSLNIIAETLETQENTYKSLQSNLREQENKAAEARENRATIQANMANMEGELNRIQTDIHDKFELSPQSLEERVYSLFDSDIPARDDLHDQKESLTRQRDGIGPVNLRAALESVETETHLATMEGEYTDLTKAIEQLRGGIAKLNREAKERLDIAFTRVNNHFQKLFTQLFEGGQAHLSMIESDDPMDSGLEIFAEPPGKALQKLSLLSGGEQTLTATALIFAMFLTNPSPICVLDEIDAPLDDANVDRVCTLMENIARDTDTRFIVITHHRMTMARMDRLYGVTMSERGVSQLVSVDIALQGEMDLAEVV